MDKNAERGESLRALDRLMEGNRRYVDAVRNDADISRLVRKRTMVDGQRPFAIVVTCSDSRVVPEHIFMAGVGDLFTVRVAGNVVADTQLASVVYAASHAGARLVLVLGHTCCGAVGAAIAGGAEGCVGAVTDLVRSAIGDERDDYAACALNVRASVDRLLRDAEVRALVEGAGVEVLGGVYRLDSGRVELLAPAAREARRPGED